MRAMSLGVAMMVGLAAMWLAGCRSGHDATTAAPTASAAFQNELDLALRAGRGQMTTSDRQALLKMQHPLLAQLADENTCKLLELFGNLPEAALTDLQRDGYVKWNVADLDPQRRRVIEQLIQVNIDLAARQGVPPDPAFSLAALARAETGFAIIDIPGGHDKVVSWFVLWPKLPDPTWVTVVNARAAGTQPYFQAHLRELPLLRAMPASPPLRG